MAKKMLINATHEEEVRVAIVDGNQLEEFDSETSTKRQIKGNVYLAKVIRIEPSLQAAFVEFGGNRHGFLPFGEIHPDYFRIPVSDRSTLQEPSQTIEEPVEDLASKEEPKKTKGRRSKKAAAEAVEKGDAVLQENPENVGETLEETEAKIDVVDEDELPRRARNYHYKIQEVIKRRQIMLIQVVKEERGNKGAALTTYLSLPGRYCVLMPNTGHRGGGISRKINDGADRRRLKDILKGLEIPEGMGLIVRTAGQERNKLEIRRDFDYLLRLWEEIRDTTLKATAPALIYAEGDLIKRSIRDVYNRDIDQILVEGEQAYKDAKAFMKALIPSHTKKVQAYKDGVPLLRRYKVEEQIDAIMNPTAKLPSGGSIVINPTEALVAIDVNSGRATKERHIDETALKTNLEAADEIARQIRLRDLAGLVVIDFIDMNENKHIQAVEKRLKEAVSRDRARIQMGHISQFGLLELSRQRLRPSLIETHSMPCHHCGGTGVVRSIESMSLLVLRAIENEGIEGRSAEIVVTVPAGVDLYLLNQKRSSVTAIEARYQMQVVIARDETIISPAFRIDCLVEREGHQNLSETSGETKKEETLEEAILQDLSVEEKSLSGDPVQGESRNRRRRRRRSFSKRHDQDHGQKETHLHEGPKVDGQHIPSQSLEATSLTNDSEAKEAVEKRGGHFRRRRRRNRSRSGHTSSEGSSENSPSQAENQVVSSIPLSQEKNQKKVTHIKEEKEVVVPMTALPEGSSTQARKTRQGRWWRRLLES